MKKRKYIVCIVVALILVIAITGVTIYKTGPVGIIEKRINREIALNMQEKDLDWEITVEGLVYEFPAQLKGRGRLSSVKHDILIDVDKIVLTPKISTLFKRSQVYEIRGEALGGSFRGVLSIGVNDDFNLKFDKLKSSFVKELSRDAYTDSDTELVISGALFAVDQTVKAETTINSIKIALPEPFNRAGALYFYDGKLDFEVVDDTITLNRGIMENNDVLVNASGMVKTLADGAYLDIKGSLGVKNTILAYILGLTEKRRGDTPEVGFSLTGPTSAYELIFLPIENDPPLPLMLEPLEIPALPEVVTNGR